MLTNAPPQTASLKENHRKPRRSTQGYKTIWMFPGAQWVPLLWTGRILEPPEVFPSNQSRRLLDREVTKNPTDTQHFRSPPQRWKSMPEQQPFKKYSIIPSSHSSVKYMCQVLKKTPVWWEKKMELSGWKFYSGYLSRKLSTRVVYRSDSVTM